MRGALPVLVLLLACRPSAAARAPELELLLYQPGDRAAPADTCDIALCTSLVELIDGAQHDIDFAIYGIRDQSRVFAALLAAQRRGVVVRGVVDRDRDGHTHYADTDALVAALGDVTSDQQADQLVAARASHPRADATMHDKFFVFDRAIVWTGSTNLSDACTGGYNANLVVIARSPELAAHYTEELARMHRGEHHGFKTQGAGDSVAIGGANVELRFSPQDDAIRYGVRPRIQHARDHIDIAMFFLTHRGVADDLITAHRRGVAVRMIIDERGAANEHSQHVRLRAAGIPVRIERWRGSMHMKAAEIDGTQVIVGSMNWTNAGESSNDENTLVIHDRASARQLHAFFEKLWSALPDPRR
jgi:phosphatidylserine/phosphatidylglycerophosphate/cardiolipin synthase-like enzyme